MATWSDIPNRPVWFDENQNLPAGSVDTYFNPRDEREFLRQSALGSEALYRKQANDNSLINNIANSFGLDKNTAVIISNLLNYFGSSPLGNEAPVTPTTQGYFENYYRPIQRLINNNNDQFTQQLPTQSYTMPGPSNPSNFSLGPIDQIELINRLKPKWPSRYEGFI